MKKNAFLLLLTARFGASVLAQNGPAKDLFVSKCAICHGADGSARGSYEPPFGALAKAVNTIVGHRIAELSLHRFVSDVAGWLTQALA